MIRMAGILLFLLSCQYLYAQTSSHKDSLRKAYLSEKNDSVKIWKHLTYINALLYDYERNKETAREIVILKKETENTFSAEVVFWTLFYEGLSEYNNYNHINSIIAIEKMNRVVMQGGLSLRAQKSAATALITLGLNYSMLNDLENAQISYQKAIRELEKFKDSSNIILTYLNMGYIFAKSQDWVGAKENFERGVLYLNEESDKDYSIPLYSSLSIADSKLGNRKESQANLDTAGILKKEFSSVVADAFYEQARGEHELLKNNFPEAINAFTKMLEFSRKWGDSSSVTESFHALGIAYWKSGNQKLALQNLMKGRELAEKKQLTDVQIVILRSLFKFYKAEGFTAIAVATADTLLLLGDQLAANQNNNRHIIVNALFESEQNAKKISSLQQENQVSKLQLKQKSIVNYILAGTAIAILLISLLSYRNYRQKQLLHKQRIHELEKEKHLVATEAVLKGQEEERSRLAKDLHDGLGGMLSGIKYSFSNMRENLIKGPENLQGFDRGLDMLDSSINELRRVAHSMMPDALMKSGLNPALKDFCTAINSSGVIKVLYQPYGIDDLKISQTRSVTIYRIVQELLSNCIKHAAATQVVVQVIRENSKLLLTVEDNGKGFDPALLQQSEGIGWLNIQNRLDYLKGKVDVQSAPVKGTSVNIEIDI